jgi:hypothetical protein
VIGLAGVAVAAFTMLRADRPGQDAASDFVPADQRPAPYTYDSVANRHFDPAHGHWHDGPPPGSAGSSSPGAPGQPSAPVPAPGPAASAPPASAPTAAPAPYTYDAETNRHWDPNHQHWHEGLPPAGR